MNEFGIAVLRFSDNQVLKDMENVIRAIEFLLKNLKNTPPTPLKRGVSPRFSMTL
jgi:very-short-patch-repair endonuclease